MIRMALSANLWYLHHWRRHWYKFLIQDTVQNHWHLLFLYRHLLLYHHPLHRPHLLFYETQHCIINLRQYPCFSHLPQQPTASIFVNMCSCHCYPALCVVVYHLYRISSYPPITILKILHTIKKSGNFFLPHHLAWSLDATHDLYARNPYIYIYILNLWCSCHVIEIFLPKFCNVDSYCHFNHL